MQVIIIREVVMFVMGVWCVIKQGKPDPAKESGVQVNPPPAPAPAETEIDVAQLMNGRRAVVLRHCADRYLLRITRHGRLILTK
ncbi:MAG: hemin uptake protein HemP [Halothiobacillaceae bacterium]